MSDPENKREQLAAEIHEVYRTTARALGWPMRPEVDVPYEQLSEAAKELDRAFADCVLEVRAAERERCARIAETLAKRRIEQLNAGEIEPEAAVNEVTSNICLTHGRDIARAIREGR